MRLQLNVRYGVKPLAAGLCWLLVFPFEALSQQEIIPKELNIVVVEGEGITTYAQQKVSPEPTIRVEDENHKPIDGAAVVFTLPTEGATGEFANGAKTFTILTDAGGLAAGRGLRTNQFPGRIPIHISVSYKGLAVRTIMNIESVLPAGAHAPAPGKKGSGKVIAILVIIAAAAGGGAAYYLTRKTGTSNSTTTATGPTPIGITPGTGTIVGGH